MKSPLVLVVELVYVKAAETPARAVVQTNSALPVAIEMEPQAALAFA